MNKVYFISADRNESKLQSNLLENNSLSYLFPLRNSASSQRMASLAPWLLPVSLAELGFEPANGVPRPVTLLLLHIQTVYHCRQTIDSYPSLIIWMMIDLTVNISMHPINLSTKCLKWQPVLRQYFPLCMSM